MREKAASREFGTGPLAKASALVYTLLVTEGLVLLGREFHRRGGLDSAPRTSR